MVNKLELTLTNLLTLVGWIYIFYLNNRGLKRSDISRTKDACITAIEKIIDDVREYSGSKDIEPLVIESELTYLATKVEMKIKNLNSITATTLVSAEDTAMIIRKCDTVELIKNKSYAVDIIDSLSDTCEQIEVSYRELYFEGNALKKMYDRRSSEIQGLAFSLLIIYMMFEIFKHLG